MNAITIRCPTCNAALNVGDDVFSVTCSYCHTPCRIQQRTRVLQLPRPMQGPSSMPVAKAPVRAGMIVALVGGLVTLIMGGMSAFLVMGRGGVSSSSHGYAPPEQQAEATTPVAPERLHWNSTRPLLRDLDGDGHDELIGVIRTYAPETHFYLTAIAGADGKVVWRSPALAEGLGNQLTVAGVADRVLLSGEDGKLYGYSLTDGKAVWTAELGEKVATMCQLADPAKIRVITEDEQGRELRLADGELGATAATGKMRRGRLTGCNSLFEGPERRYGQELYDVFRRVPDVRGMSTRFMVKRGDVGIIAGSKSPGTAVPMLARLDKREVAWRIELPTSNHLTASFKEEILYYDERVVLATYSTTSSSGETRLVALAPADGKRLWEASLTSADSMGSMVLSSVFATQKHAVVVTWTSLMALDLQTGKRVFTIGG